MNSNLFEGHRFIAVLRKYGVSVCYLFGSRASGQAYDDSDVDLAVLFKEYKPEVHHLDYVAALEEELQQLTSRKVQVLCLQAVRDIALKFEIISSGKVMYSEDEDFRTDFEDVLIRDYLDFKPVLDLYYRELEEEILGN
ncbi:MAG: nucleotidyltransferase domain-containing protein [Bacillota bacterium]